jgi:hypothetical protein
LLLVVVEAGQVIPHQIKAQAVGVVACFKDTRELHLALLIL